MAAPLLMTKLYIPPVRPEFVPRPRLIEQLNAGLDRKLTFVSAPAGFGKTTLVADWLSRVAVPCTWLSLDESDNDPAQFMTYLIAALQRVDQGIGQVAESLLAASQLPPIESLVTLLINDIVAVQKPSVLVLDDYHVIRTKSIHRAVEILIERQPPSVQLVLVTRQDPPLPLPRLRLRGQVVEVQQGDLRFTTDEARAFFSQGLGLDLDLKIITALESRTEGWIAGLQLAALSVQGRSAEGIAEFVEVFSGSHRHVIDYRAEEVLAQQSEDVRGFLYRTSILDRLTAPLCDAVTGRSDSRQVLRKLDSANLFLIPLDDERKWYRYHHLFADFLRTELDAESLAALHRRAAHWLTARGLMPEAVKHALASGDQALAAGVIARASAEEFSAGSFATLLQWLDALPDEVVRSHSELATQKGCLLYFTGQISQAAVYADAAERSLPPEATLASRGRLLSLKAHLALYTGDLNTTLQFSREALDCLEPSDAAFRNLTSNVLGQVLESQGDVLAAVEVYREAVHVERGVGSEVGALVVLTNLVFALNELGRRRDAVAVCQQVLSEGGSLPGRDLPVSEGVHLAWALLSYEANELERAREQVVQVLKYAEEANIADGIVWGRLILARVYLASGDLGAARQVAREGRQFAASLDTFEGKVQWFAAVGAHICLLEGNFAAAARWAQESGFSSSDTPHHWDEFTYFAYVRLLLVQDRLGDARTLLDTMEQAAGGGERRRKLITIYLLQACVCQAQGKTQQAIVRVEKALALAAAEDYFRAFLDEGPAIIELLPRVRHQAPDFVSRLLAAASASQKSGPSSRSHTLVEPLSEREYEILRLIAAGRSNPEIAEILYLSLNTVKWHAKNLYGKLQVGSRIEAVARAQELGLL